MRFHALLYIGNVSERFNYLIYPNYKVQKLGIRPKYKVCCTSHCLHYHINFNTILYDFPSWLLWALPTTYVGVIPKFIRHTLLEALCRAMFVNDFPVKRKDLPLPFLRGEAFFREHFLTANIDNLLPPKIGIAFDCVFF